MPTLIKRDLLPVLLNIVRFDEAEGEEIFLTYTHGRENGPEICRTGKGSPFMQDLSDGALPGEFTTDPNGQRLGSWLIQEDLKVQDQAIGAQLLESLTAQATDQ